MFSKTGLNTSFIHLNININHSYSFYIPTKIYIKKIVT